MKRSVTMMLAGTVMLLLFSSCATTPKTPLGEGEMRLLGIEAPQSGNLLSTVSYGFTVTFEADGHPEVTRACIYWSGDGPQCYPIKTMTYGSHSSFEVVLYPALGQNRLEVYAEYVLDGKKMRTNRVSMNVYGYTFR
jgi:hypothetical protein